MTMTGPNQYKPVSHVIFDMDGLLLDTENHYTQASQMYLQRFGKEFSWECKQKLMGRKQRDACQMFIEFYSLNVTVDEYIQENQQVLESLFPTASLLPGVERLVRHLFTNGIPICICTGSTRRGYELKTSRHKELFSLFHHVVFSPDDPEVVHGKPEPDCFLVGARRFEPPLPHPENVLVFEDAVNGVEAALKANMQVVLVPDKRMDECHRQKATLCLDSLEDFRPELFGLPAY